MSSDIPALKERGPLYFRRSTANRLRRPQFKHLFMPHIKRLRFGVGATTTKTSTRCLLHMLHALRKCPTAYSEGAEWAIRLELSVREHVPNKQEARRLRSFRAKGDPAIVAWFKVFGYYPPKK